MEFIFLLAMTEVYYIITNATIIIIMTCNATSLGIYKYQFNFMCYDIHTIGMGKTIQAIALMLHVAETTCRQTR